MGGGMTKSAYYVTYISQKELTATEMVNKNYYDPVEATPEKSHPYGKKSNQEIILKITADNRKLMTEVDDFKGNEIAKKVTTCYERSYDEITKVVEQKLPHKEIGSFYVYLLNKPETIELGKRLLLDQCFFTETGSRVQTMERVQGILIKI